MPFDDLYPLDSRPFLYHFDNNLSISPIAHYNDILYPYDPYEYNIYNPKHKLNVMAFENVLIPTQRC